MWTLDRAREVSQQLQQDLDNRLHSVVAFRDPYDRDERPWQVLVVLRDATPEVLSTIGARVGEAAGGLEVYRYDELMRGADVLGLFLWTVRRSYKVLLGPDPIEDIRPRTRSLRLQLELRLRRLQLRTRQVWMMNGEPEERRVALGRLCLSGRELTRMAEAILDLPRAATLAQESHLKQLTAHGNDDATPAEIDAGFDLLLSILERGVAEVDRY